MISLSFLCIIILSWAFRWHNTYALKFGTSSWAKGRPQLVGSTDREQLTVFLNSAVSTEFSSVLFFLTNWSFLSGTLQQSGVPLCVMTTCCIPSLFKLEAAEGTHIPFYSLLYISTILAESFCFLVESTNYCVTFCWKQIWAQFSKGLFKTWIILSHIVTLGIRS